MFKKGHKKPHFSWALKLLSGKKNPNKTKTEDNQLESQPSVETPVSPWQIGQKILAKKVGEQWV